MTSMAVSIAAMNRHGAGTVADSLHMIHKEEAESESGPGMGFLNLKAHPR